MRSSSIKMEKLKRRGVVDKALKQNNTPIDDTVKFVYGRTEAFMEMAFLRTLLKERI